MTATDAPQTGPPDSMPRPFSGPDSFWLRMVDNSEKQQALAVLELTEPVTLTDIKQRYRTLLSQAHPDKGGCHQRTLQLNEAMAVLKRCY